MIIPRKAFTFLMAALTSVFSGGPVYADTLGFGVDGHPIDLSANVRDSILPGGTVAQDSKPLFGTTSEPNQSAELLYLSPTGVNASGRSTNISAAFASALAESNGNGGVGVSQLIFGNPGGSGDGVRQLVAQSLWTQSFVNQGIDPVEITLHLHIPDLQVQLLDVAPRRSSPSATETAEASASVVTTITHQDLTQIEGSRFDYGLREFERQLISGRDLINFGDIEVLGQTGTVISSLKFNGDDFNPPFTLDSVSFDLRLGVLQPGDTLSYVYTLTAQGTTHGFEHGYDAFIGDPFGANGITDNLRVTAALAGAPEPGPVVSGDVPEPSTSALLLLGLAALFLRRWPRCAPSFQCPH